MPACGGCRVGGRHDGGVGGVGEAGTSVAGGVGPGDGPPDAQGEAKLGQLREHLKAFGRDPATFGLEAWIRFNEPDPQQWAAAVQGWKRLGAQMVMLYPMYRMPKFEDQIETLRRFKEVVGG